MPTIAEQFASIFREFETPGIPSSGAHEPVRSEIRGLGLQIEDAFVALEMAGVGVIKKTKALLDADLAHGADSFALVLFDTDATKNGFYVKSGASGSGYWSGPSALPTQIMTEAQAALDSANEILALWPQIEQAVTDAEDARDAANDAAGIAEAFAGQVYANTAAGEAATATGHFFLVSAGGTPRNYAVYERTSGGSVLAAAMASSTALAGVNGAYLIGFGASTLGDISAQFVHLKKHGLNKAGLLAALAEQQSTGGALILPPQGVTISGWDTPFAQTAPLYIWGQGMDPSALNFTSATASFIHQLDPILCMADFTLSGLTANTSANGGGAVYALVADGATIVGAVAPKFHRMRFDG